MRFKEILPLLKSGQPIHRKKWSTRIGPKNKNRYLAFRDLTILEFSHGRLLPWIPKANDVRCKDWELFAGPICDDEPLPLANWQLRNIKQLVKDRIH